MGGSVFVNDASLSQLINHGYRCWHFIRCFFFVLYLAKITNCITGCFAIILISFTAFFSLAGIFLCRFMICHVLFFLRTAKVRLQRLSAKESNAKFSKGTALGQKAAQ